MNKNLASLLLDLYRLCYCESAESVVPEVDPVVRQETRLVKEMSAQTTDPIWKEILGKKKKEKKKHLLTYGAFWWQLRHVRISEIRKSNT